MADPLVSARPLANQAAQPQIKTDLTWIMKEESDQAVSSIHHYMAPHRFPEVVVKHRSRLIRKIRTLSSTMDPFFLIGCFSLSQLANPVPYPHYAPTHCTLLKQRTLSPPHTDTLIDAPANSSCKERPMRHLARKVAYGHRVV